MLLGERRAGMKLSRTGLSYPARAFRFPIALAVLGFASSHLWAAKAQLIDTSEQSYYLNARPLLDYPLQNLLTAVPELRGLEPAENQDDLDSLLDKAGDVTEDLLGSMPNLISREEVTQQRPSLLGLSVVQGGNEDPACSARSAPAPEARLDLLISQRLCRWCAFDRAYNRPLRRET
jgi:hypothetical protein